MLRLMKLKLICIYIEHKAWPKWVVPPLATCPCWKVVLQLRQAVGTCWWSPRCLKHPQNSTGGFSLSWRWKPWGFLWNQDATLLLVPLSRWTASLAMEDRAPKEYAFLYCHVWGLRLSSAHFQHHWGHHLHSKQDSLDKGPDKAHPIQQWAKMLPGLFFKSGYFHLVTWNVPGPTRAPGGSCRTFLWALKTSDKLWPISSFKIKESDDSAGFLAYLGTGPVHHQKFAQRPIQTDLEVLWLKLERWPKAPCCPDPQSLHPRFTVLHLLPTGLWLLTQSQSHLMAS